jgi:hypothetical protein
MQHSSETQAPTGTRSILNVAVSVNAPPGTVASIQSRISSKGVRAALASVCDETQALTRVLG